MLLLVFELLNFLNLADYGYELILIFRNFTFIHLYLIRKLIVLLLRFCFEGLNLALHVWNSMLPRVNLGFLEQKVDRLF